MFTVRKSGLSRSTDSGEASPETKAQGYGWLNRWDMQVLPLQFRNPTLPKAAACLWWF